MILYRAFQPLLLGIFGALAFILKRVPALREKTEKFWKTYDIRYVASTPVFLKIDPKVFSSRAPIWIHAASGEFEYAKPVIRELAKRSLPVLVTYFSPTFAKNVHSFPGVIAACPLPLDSRDEMELFLNHLKPAVFLIARTDAWPNTVLAASEKRIPILLFSTTFHNESKRMRGFGRTLTFETLKRIDEIQCVSEEDRIVLNSLGLKNVTTCGDTRYDQVLERLRAPKPLPPQLAPVTESRSMVAGSVWPEDLIPVLKASCATYRTFRHTLFLVPHEISEPFIEEIRREARKLGVAMSEIIRFSELIQAPIATNKFRVIVVDQIGILAELYQLGEIAFVGGSFRKSVHSVMEPLAAGALTIVGPLHTNNREAIEFQKITVPEDSAQVRIVTCARDTDDFTVVLERLWRVSSSSDFRSAIKAEVAKRGGATASVLRWLSERDI